MWTRISDLDRMFTTMDLLRGKMDRLVTGLDGSYGEGSGWRVVGGFPRTNMYDNGDSFQVIAELPGVAKEDVSIRIQGNYLELSGLRKAEVPEGFKAQRIERETSSFTRSFTLDAEVNADKVDAVLKDGLLTLVLPKAESAKPKQISIN
jgi:HSP20 family protein